MQSEEKKDLADTVQHTRPCSCSAYTTRFSILDPVQHTRPGCSGMFGIGHFRVKPMKLLKPINAKPLHDIYWIKRSPSTLELNDSYPEPTHFIPSTIIPVKTLCRNIPSAWKELDYGTLIQKLDEKEPGWSKLSLEEQINLLREIVTEKLNIKFVEVEEVDAESLHKALNKVPVTVTFYKAKEIRSNQGEVIKRLSKSKDVISGTLILFKTDKAAAAFPYFDLFIPSLNSKRYRIDQDVAFLAAHIPQLCVGESAEETRLKRAAESRSITDGGDKKSITDGGDKKKPRGGN